MADTATTPASAPEVTQPTPEQLHQEAEQYRMKVAQAVVPHVIIDRLARVHGFQINSEAEANQVVKAAADLFEMKRAGLINLEPEAKLDSPLAKAASEVSALVNEINSKHQGNQKMLNAVLSDADVWKNASEFVKLVTA